MLQFIKKMYKKHEEVVNYLIFGFLAFIVNMIAYMAAAWVLGADEDKTLLVNISTAFAWVISVLFAYWTNHSFVFKSKVRGKELRQEFLSFVGARVATGVLEQVIMIVMTRYMKIDHILSKLVCNFIVIVTNYFFSKLLVFRNRKKTS